MVQTSELARKQIEAMKSDVFELGLLRLPSALEERDADMLPRAWDSETLLRSVAWLRYENMSGRNIYIRPQGEHHLSLIDVSDHLKTYFSGPAKRAGQRGGSA